MIEDTERDIPLDNTDSATERGMFRSLFQVGSAHAVGTVLAIVRNKLYAVWLGAVGVGLLSQLGGYLQFLAALGLLSTSKGLTREISRLRAEGRADELRSLLRYSFVFFTVLSGLLLLPGLCFPSVVSALVLGKSRLGPLIIWVTLPLVFVVWNGILEAIIIGCKDTSGLSRGRTLGNVAALAVLVPIVYFWRLDGAVVGFLCVAVIALVITTYYARRAIRPERLSSMLGRPVGTRLFKTILYFGLTGAIITVLTNGSYLFARRILIDRAGLVGNGIFQAAWGLSHQILPLLLISVSAYFYPRLCELSEPSALAKETARGLVFAATMCAPVAALVAAFRFELIRLLYAQDFVSAGNTLIIMMLAEYVWVGSWAFSNAMVAGARLRVVTAIVVVSQLVFCVSAHFLVDKLGQIGVALSYCFGNVLLSAGGAVWARQRLGMRLRWLCCYRMVLSAALVALAALVSLLGFHEKLLVPLGVGVWLLAMLARRTRLAGAG